MVALCETFASGLRSRLVTRWPCPQVMVQVAPRRYVESCSYLSKHAFEELSLCSEPLRGQHITIPGYGPRLALWVILMCVTLVTDVEWGC